MSDALLLQDRNTDRTVTETVFLLRTPSPTQPTCWIGKVSLITKRRCNNYFFPNKLWRFSTAVKALWNPTFRTDFSKLTFKCMHHSSYSHLNFFVPFISLQVYHDSEEGQRYIQFYKLNKFPYISILDPRTGECSCELRYCNRTWWCSCMTFRREWCC